MVVHDRGYKRWDGDRDAAVAGVRVIFERGVRTGLAQLFRRKLIAQMLSFVAFGPFLFALGFIYAIYFFSANAGQFGNAAQDLRQSEVFSLVAPSPSTVWAYLFEVQLLVVLVLCALIGTSQIAEDRRTNALELYFCRPLNAAQYLLGKLAVLVFFLALVTVLPACVLIVAQMVLGGAQEGRLVELTDLLLRTVLAGGGAVTFLALLVITASSLAKRARQATILAGAVLGALELLIALPLRESFRDPVVNLVSLSFDVGQVGAWVLGNETDLHPGVPVSHAAAVLGLWVLACVLVLRRRLRPIEVVA